MAIIDPYKSGKFKSNPYAKKSNVGGPLVVVLDGKMEDRGLSLIIPISRCIKKDEVHELILTDEGAQPGATVNRIAYLGFFTAEQSGVLVSGDVVMLGGKVIGKLVGFDETHMPNHLNIVIETADLRSGLEYGANPGDQILFQLKPQG